MACLAPELRFDGYTDAWEQRKLDELAVFGGGHTPSMADESNYVDGKVLWTTSQDVKVDYLSDTTTKLSEKGASELKLYPIGTLLMVTRSGILRHTLPVCMLQKPSTVNQDIRAINTNEDCSSIWLMQHFKARSKDFLLEYGKTGTTVESIDFAKMKSMALMLPAIDEQRVIGDFFYQLDNLITLHQREYDKLVTTKQAMLQKMFPKPDKTVPEVRFEGFDESWCQATITEVSDRVCVGFVGQCEPYYTDERGVPMYRTGNLNTDELNTDDLKYVTREFHEAQEKSQLREGDLLIARHGDSGKAVVYREQSDANCLNIVIIRPNQNVCVPDYLKECLNSPRTATESKRRTVGSTQKVINTKEIEQLQIVLPRDYREQRMIGGFFREYNRLISIKAQELIKLKQLRSALLQKMFV